MKKILFALLLACQFSAITADQKTFTYQNNDQYTLNLDCNTGCSIILNKFEIKNDSQEEVSHLFITAGHARDFIKSKLLNDDELKTQIRKWLFQNKAELTHKGFFIPSSGTLVQFPSREVPSFDKDQKEYFFNDQWHYVDQKNQTYLSLDNQTIVGYEDIADEPFIALRKKVTSIKAPFSQKDAYANFASFDLFPADFCCFEPAEEAPELVDASFDLYPTESVFYLEDAYHQTVVLEKRAKSAEGFFEVHSLPISAVINRTKNTITLDEQNLLIEPGQAADLLNTPTHLRILTDADEGRIEIINKVAFSLDLNPGENQLFINSSNTAAGVKVNIDYTPVKTFAPRAQLVDKLGFYEGIPSFNLTADVKPDSIWWQISADQDFATVISNFERIEPFKAQVLIDLISSTYFDNGKNYYFRFKTKNDDTWSKWSEVYPFTIHKPEPVRSPKFKKIESGIYEISWAANKMAGTTYKVYGSNSFDFLPSLYNEVEYSLIDEEKEVSDEVDNLIEETTGCSIRVGTKYAYYRIVTENRGVYSNPSPLIHVYDYGLKIPRTTLQKTKEYKAERIAFPPAYKFDQELLDSFPHKVIGQHAYYVYNPHVEASRWNFLSNFFLPENHPVKPKLDRLFKKRRVTENEASLKKGGFLKPEPMEFSKTIVSRNKKVPGIMFKFFSDAQSGIDDATRALARVAGSLYIRASLDQYQINHLFAVPEKWIYPLPVDPAPKSGTRKNFIVVETELDIYEGRENNKMWKSPIVNPVTLTWLYRIMKELGLCDSPYAFNLPITKDNRISFIDTEHHHEWPVPFFKLIAYLNHDMEKFWKKLMEENK